MNNHVLYLGDGTIEGPAAYLAAVLQHADVPVHHVPADQPLSTVTDADIRNAAVIVFSDYPFENLTAREAQLVVTANDGGVGLVMFGGWRSYAIGGYRGTVIEQRLPVAIGETDDRVNCAQPCIAVKRADHPVLESLPFAEPPGIGGYNRVVADPDAVTVLEAVRFGVHADDVVSFEPDGDPDPLLVVREAAGRSVAFMTDVAPHWVGGLVDWGDARVREQISGREVEVGNWYARLFQNMVAWASGGRAG